MNEKTWILVVEGEGEVETIRAESEAEAVSRAESLIAEGEYDLEPGEELTVRYWLRQEGKQGEARATIAKAEEG